MGEREDEQAHKLNKTMDEFLGTVNSCLSQLAIEMKKVEDTTGAQVTQMRFALTKKQSLRLPTDENQRLRTELGRMEAQFTLAQQTRCWWMRRLCVNTTLTKWVELQAERLRLHSSNQQFCKKLETEALEYQHEVNKSTEQQVQAKLNQEVAKIQAEMTKFVNEATASRSQLKAQFEQEMGKVRAAGKQEHAARTQAEQALVSMREARDRRLQELNSKCGCLKEQCHAWMMQMRSAARAFKLSGTVQLEDVEWHKGRHKLFDQLLDDCACECERSIGCRW
eukprot:1913333-Amphidinium_carterae.2